MPAVMLATTMRERTTGTYVFTIAEYTGYGLDVADLTTLTLTYFDVETGTILNGRENQDALNANGVTVVTTGSPPHTTVEWTLTSDDTVMVSARPREVHSILFQWTWGTRRAAYEVHFLVENLVGVA